jgi:hypothetical protein
VHFCLPKKSVYFSYTQTADLWFHTLVMLVELGTGPEAVLEELERRFGRLGIAEKAGRGRKDYTKDESLKREGR